VKATDSGLPSINDILGLQWDEVVLDWPMLEKRVNLVPTGPLRTPKAQPPGPWRVVGVRESSASGGGCWQVVLAREYW
jgi:hypothetical protein